MPFVDGQSLPLVFDGTERVVAWIFAGGLASASIARAIGEAGQTVVGWDDVSVTVRDHDAGPLRRALAQVDPATSFPMLPEEVGKALKFGLCLPSEVARAEIIARTTDRPAVAATMSRRPRTLVCVRR